jgi:hypothetical protein
MGCVPGQPKSSSCLREGDFDVFQDMVPSLLHVAAPRGAGRGADLSSRWIDAWNLRSAGNDSILRTPCASDTSFHHSLKAGRASRLAAASRLRPLLACTRARARETLARRPARRFGPTLGRMLDCVRVLGHAVRPGGRAVRQRQSAQCLARRETALLYLHHRPMVSP